jgi:hypothetical protein
MTSNPNFFEVMNFEVFDERSVRNNGVEYFLLQVTPIHFWVSGLAHRLTDAISIEIESDYIIDRLSTHIAKTCATAPDVMKSRVFGKQLVKYAEGRCLITKFIPRDMLTGEILNKVKPRLTLKVMKSDAKKFEREFGNDKTISISVEAVIHRIYSDGNRYSIKPVVTRYLFHKK